MNILIVEDNDEKRNAIIKAIKDKCSNAKIRWFNNYEDSARFIEDNKGYINLLLLDWCFPQTSYSQSPVYGAGRLLLKRIKALGLEIKTIIISSDHVNVDKEDYPFVEDSVRILSEDSIADDAQTPLDLSERVVAFRKPNVSLDPNIQIISKDPVKSKKNGYHRRKSSTPWWMQN
jgi:hypothetical protein